MFFTLRLRTLQAGPSCKCNIPLHCFEPRNAVRPFSCPFGTGQFTKQSICPACHVPSTCADSLTVALIQQKYKRAHLGLLRGQQFGTTWGRNRSRTSSTILVPIILHIVRGTFSCSNLDVAHPVDHFYFPRTIEGICPELFNASSKSPESADPVLGTSLMRTQGLAI